MLWRRSAACRKRGALDVAQPLEAVGLTGEVERARRTLERGSDL